MKNSQELTAEEREAWRRDFEQYIALCKYAQDALGARNWSLLRVYGRIMAGPHSGKYVSSLPLDEARRLVEELVVGESVDVHLMHRHRSGDYTSSSLQLIDGSFVMHFPDRDETA